MSKFVGGAIVTGYGLANNNRGESEGNTTTLHKGMYKGEQHTYISAEAARKAFRDGLKELGYKVNRDYTKDDDFLLGAYEWKDPNFNKEEHYADDDLLGFMLASSDTTARRSPLSVSRAVSLDPWCREIIVAFGGAGATRNATSKTNRKKTSKETEDTSKPAPSHPTPYNAEVHATRYQFFFGLSVEALRDQSLAVPAVKLLTRLHRVGGNHSRNYFDFSAESVVLRVSDHSTHRIANCFEHDDEYNVQIPTIIRRVKSGDIVPSELYIGGLVADNEDVTGLKELGVNVFSGVDSCMDAVIQQLG